MIHTDFSVLSLLNPLLVSSSQDALKTFQDVVDSTLAAWGGYWVSCHDGALVATFMDPAHGIRWALMTISACLNAAWSAELLEHELAGE
jgi:hypothetical protein